VETLEDRVALSAVSFSVDPGSLTLTAGVSAAVTVTAKDASNNTATDYRGTISLSSSDATAVLTSPLTSLPASYTFTAADNGVHTFPVTLHVAGSQTVKATDTTQTSITGTGSVTIAPAALYTFAVKLTGAAGPITAGSSQGFQVTAQDAFANTITNYLGTVHFGSDDPQGLPGDLPGDYTFTTADQGVHAFTPGATLKTTGNRTLTAGVPNNPNVFPGAAGVFVNPGPVDHLGLNIQANGVAGAPLDATVKALDKYNNLVPTYTGTVHFGSTDPHGTLPADYTFTAGASNTDNGTHTFPGGVLLQQAATQTVAVDAANGSPSLPGGGGTSAIAIAPGAVSVLKITPSFSLPTPAGTLGGFTATAQDKFGNLVIGYRGTVHLASSDAQVVLPADYTFTTADQGVHFFPATLKTAGNQTLTAIDTGNTVVSGNASVPVVPAGLTKIVVAGLPTSSITAGTSLPVTVSARDAFNNTIPTFGGTVDFSSSDAQAILPARYTFTAGDQGTHVFIIIFTTGGGQSLTILDLLTGLTGGQNGIPVVNPVPVLVSMSQSSAPANGAIVNLTVTGLNFVPASVVRWNGIPLATTFVSNTQLQASLPTGLIPGSGVITVFNPAPGGGVSNGLVFTLGDNIPSVPNSPPPTNLINTALAFAHSTEHFQQFLQRAYVQYLKRDPDVVGIGFWIRNMQAGVYTDEQVEAFFLGSQEYIANHGGTNKAWVVGMYEDLLGREPTDAETQNWVKVLASGTSTNAVALGFAASPERETARVQTNYQTYLQRAPAQSEVDQWVKGFVSGLTNEDMVAGFVGSPEYYLSTQKGQSNTAQWVDQAYHDVLSRGPSFDEVKLWLGTLH
jgi:hypothetical protein